MLCVLILMGVGTFLIFIRRGPEKKKWDPEVLALVSDQPISEKDMEQEYTLLISGNADGIPFAELESSARSSIKQNLFKGILERKIAYAYIQKEHPDFLKNFDSKPCRKEVEKIPKNNLNKEKVRDLLCERALVDSFLQS